MTDPIDPSATDGADDAEDTGAPLTPAQDAAVRRALAEAGGPEPMPEEVVARLDAVITSLAADRPATPEISHPEDHRILPLDPFARHRRVRARYLLAAAAVVVAGAVGAGIVTDRGGSDDAMTAADQMSDDDPARSDAGGDSGLAESPASGDDKAVVPSTAGQEAAPSQPSSLPVEPRRIVTDEPLREVRADSLREDLVALQHITLPHPAAAEYDGATLTAPKDFMCEPADFGLGYLVGVEYDGKPAVVAFRDTVGQTQEAEVLACGTGDVLHSTTLAATG
jgi:hypothetical protein